MLLQICAMRSQRTHQCARAPQRPQAHIHAIQEAGAGGARQQANQRLPHCVLLLRIRLRHKQQVDV